MIRRLALATTALVAIAATQAHAGTMRCGSAVINSGDTLAEVREHCGEPETRIRLVNEWGAQVGWKEIHKPGAGRLRRAVLIEGNRVVGVQRAE